MTAIFTLKEWKEIASHGTSGDQVYDILASWENSLDRLIAILGGEKIPYHATQEEWAYNQGLTKAIVKIRLEKKRNE